jgi:hypothetical protein
MDPVTGCISIGVEQDASVVVHRVIEYFKPACDSAVLWVDIFADNSSHQSQSLTIIHRGAFTAIDVTSESWSASPTSTRTMERSLRERVTRLHQTSEPIQDLGESFVVASVEYSLPAAKPTIVELVGGSDGCDVDVPFTMWEIRGFPEPGSRLLRLRLDMGRGTFDARIRNRNEFYAYGEDILLQKILHEDLPSYKGPDAQKYRTAFDAFSAKKHLVPDKFEYLLVSDEGTTLGWGAAPLSADVSTRWIGDPRLVKCTAWFVIDTMSANRFEIGGIKRNNYALRITPGSVVVLANA